MITEEDRKEYVRCIFGSRLFKKQYRDSANQLLVCRALPYAEYQRRTFTQPVDFLCFADTVDGRHLCSSPVDRMEVVKTCQEFEGILADLFSGLPVDFLQSAWFQRTIECVRNHWLDYESVTREHPESITREEFVHSFLCGKPASISPTSMLIEAPLQKYAVPNDEVPAAVAADDSTILHFVKQVCQQSQPEVDGRPVSDIAFEREMQKLFQIFH